MVIAQPDTDMLLIYDEQEAESLLGQKEQDMLLLQSQGENNKKYPLGNSPPLHPV